MVRVGLLPARPAAEHDVRPPSIHNPSRHAENMEGACQASGSCRSREPPPPTAQPAGEPSRSSVFCLTNSISYLPRSQTGARSGRIKYLEVAFLMKQAGN